MTQYLNISTEYRTCTCMCYTWWSRSTWNL